MTKYLIKIYEPNRFFMIHNEIIRSPLTVEIFENELEQYKMKIRVESITKYEIINLDKKTNIYINDEQINDNKKDIKVLNINDLNKSLINDSIFDESFDENISDFDDELED